MRPYGYDKEDEIVDEEAAIIRELARRLLQEKESMRSCVADLRDRGVLTSAGNQWTQNSMKRIMVNPRLAGRKIQRGEVVPAPWKPILDIADHEALVALLDDPSRKQGPSSKDPKYLLSGGKLACGRELPDSDGDGTHLCGKTLYTQPSSAGTRGYVCRKASPSYGCGRLRIAAGPLEEEVTTRVLARLASPKVRERLATAVGVAAGGKESVEEAITAIKGRVSEAREEYVTRGISMATLKAIENRANTEIQQLNEQLEQQRRLKELPATTADGLAEWWVDAPLERRRDLIGLVLDKVIVKPASVRGSSGLDKDRLEFVWK
ncbi:hypothetical protein Ait01nite_020530 [Actinoplanes italicus]|uniref:Recombinase n=1 Tax=Actinoplanes italicus TaxID=113567 RepID=A0A2T0KP89_9ACTN|nr:recombinase family protein [Actinoplanes italicus]PRX25548.1 recombinase [Actinoplanes italicus]GIE29008.1 hypothetical protein Ait01nite_020530 [Actinoplanes italicus]